MKRSFRLTIYISHADRVVYTGMHSTPYGCKFRPVMRQEEFEDDKSARRQWRALFGDGI